jgi:hypothetical protein
MQGHFAIEASVFLISGASMHLGYHGTLTETFLFVTNCFDKNKHFEVQCIVQMRKLVRREWSEVQIFQSLSLAAKLRGINWQRREY